ncbi:hypothetical protein BC827DRAFT_514558 [Russula dissimulans]|nr:hypothetical protein BC827DRAFT_514558 [Russula dissimulans]
MIVEETSPDVGGVDWSFESTASKCYTPSHFDSPSNDPSPAPYGSLQFFNSFSLSPLFQHSSCDSDPEVHSNNAFRSSVRPLDEGEDPIFTFPPEWIAAFGNSGICLGQGKAAEPTREDDEALVRMSIRSLDVGEEPVFELPSGWKEAFVSPPDATVPSSSQPQTTRKISVLPRLKSLWKRATSKFGSRQV